MSRCRDGGCRAIGISGLSRKSRVGEKIENSRRDFAAKEFAGAPTFLNSRAATFFKSLVAGMGYPTQKWDIPFSTSSIPAPRRIVRRRFRVSNDQFPGDDAEKCDSATSCRFDLLMTLVVDSVTLHASNEIIYTCESHYVKEFGDLSAKCMENGPQPPSPSALL